MARAVIFMPGGEHPWANNTELHDLDSADVQPNGVLATRRDGEEPVYYAPGAWHSCTSADNVRLLTDD